MWTTIIVTTYLAAATGAYQAAKEILSELNTDDSAAYRKGAVFCSLIAGAIWPWILICCIVHRAIMWLEHSE